MEKGIVLVSFWGAYMAGHLLIDLSQAQGICEVVSISP
jgi:hypothetical protein